MEQQSQCISIKAEINLVIEHSSPVLVLDDVKQELWEISHGLSVCGLPLMQHLIIDGTLERKPTKPYEGVRLLFTDLHVLGPTNNRPAQYVSALVKFIRELISPSTYLIVFWSAFPEDAEEAWSLLVTRLKAANSENLIPFGYKVLDKTEVKSIADDDPDVSAKAAENVKASISAIFDEFPQLESIMQWEFSAARAASATSNELIGRLIKGGFTFNDGNTFKATLKRMAQEALGLPHAPNTPTRGVYQALMPIAQDWLNKQAANGALDAFLDLNSREKVTLPPEPQGKPKLTSLLNDFFIHSERPDLQSSERGVVIRLPEDFLANEGIGLVGEVGLATTRGDWREALCAEFAHSFSTATLENKKSYKEKLASSNVYVVELSADCDYAQDKSRSHRFLLSLFSPSSDPKPFYQRNCGANDAIYVTPEITLEGVQGRLLISCRIFLTRPYKTSVAGVVVTRLRQEVLSEIAHLYSTHMRRPGKIAFF
uniref:hypothetical protein n=1 Tax=Alcaligenes faecalis TaxID=511 RepID=UPI003D016C2F